MFSDIPVRFGPKDVAKEIITYPVDTYPHPSKISPLSITTSVVRSRRGGVLGNINGVAVLVPCGPTVVKRVSVGLDHDRPLGDKVK